MILDELYELRDSLNFREALMGESSDVRFAVGAIEDAVDNAIARIHDKPTVKKISDDPFWARPLCGHEQHDTPKADFEPGQYEHVCPGCGNAIRFGVWIDEKSGRKDYRQFQHGGILGGTRS